MSVPTIAICVATYRRRWLLARLLDGLSVLEIPEGLTVELRVVENDRDARCRVLVESWAPANGRIQARYAVEKRRNIALARNRALDMGEATYFAFIDDDEVPEPNWLTMLFAKINADSFDAVFGEVEAELPAAAPRWLREGDYLSKRVWAELPADRWQGTRTANALVRGEWLRGRRFRAAFGRSGGEDTELFARMVREGARLGWQPGARVREFVHAEQCNLGWLFARFRRAGRVYERIVEPTVPRAFMRSGVRIATGVWLCAIGALPWLSGRRRLAYRGVLQFATAIGGIEQAIGWRAESAGYRSAGCRS